MATSYSPKIITDGLVLALDAANTKSYPGSGTTWRDLSGNGNNGTLTNGPTYNSTNGGSIVFDGLNDYVDIGVKGTLNPSTITVSAWMKPESSLSSKYIIRNRTYGWGILITDSMKLATFVYTNSSVSSAYTSDITLSSLYYNTVFTFSNSNLNVYLNGTLLNSVTTPSNSIYYVENYVAVGRDANADVSYFLGNISQVSVYNRALTAAEILQNYNATKGRYGL
jgi:hypothetical protein